jgi:hypothetical protein
MVPIGGQEGTGIPRNTSNWLKIIIRFPWTLSVGARPTITRSLHWRLMRLKGDFPAAATPELPLQLEVGSTEPHAAAAWRPSAPGGFVRRQSLVALQRRVKPGEKRFFVFEREVSQRMQEGPLVATKL